MNNKKNENVRFALNLISLIVFIVCMVIGILTFTNVIKEKFYLPISAIVFLMSAYVTCIYDYSLKIIDKRRFVLQLFMYLIIFMITFLYLLMSIFGA